MVKLNFRLFDSVPSSQHHEITSHSKASAADPSTADPSAADPSAADPSTADLSSADPSSADQGEVSTSFFDKMFHKLKKILFYNPFFDQESNP